MKPRFVQAAPTQSDAGAQAASEWRLPQLADYALAAGGGEGVAFPVAIEDG